MTKNYLQLAKRIAVEAELAPTITLQINPEDLLMVIGLLALGIGAAAQEGNGDLARAGKLVLNQFVDLMDLSEESKNFLRPPMPRGEACP